MRAPACQPAADAPVVGPTATPGEIVKAQLRLPYASSTLALALSLVGCFSWRPYAPAAPLSQSTALPSRLRATLADSSRVELISPFVRADTLYGRSGPRRETLALAVSSLRRLERGRFSVWRTLGVIVGAPAAALVAAYAVVCGNGGCQPTY
jgi:hypothetical protein